ncbi:nucleotide sugar dehydrogenase [Marinifilum sp. D714]|uniref:nucleotide sugar dehydrogenase n=1 Tax=Marinifilum sp. D714 TaxID=2937523 RepID=UPI0027C51E4B|nr:nucleotide sugar dehydrogenase [Marinifilum sp. D714]MDQ2179819.1 nucleotide sugar dehydrogenase [Marinifilum sp. D714]
MKIAVIGLGYVGLPLAVEFAKKYNTLGFDINDLRVKELNCGADSTLEVNDETLKESLKNGLKLSADLSELADANVFIVTVPTPIDLDKNPDLSPLKGATEMIAKFLKKEDVVIYESTVYPGCTEEVCVPILEKISGLVYNKEFYCGYSPERINPGDKVNTLTKIKKVTSGSNEKTAGFVDDLYKSIIEAGTHLASNIKVAEASKAVENAQRDVNISFVNELALIFDKLDIDTSEVLDAAGTKWNFLKYKPGLVGGHCISVDPYYLAYKAESVGYLPNVILSGRRVNDNMGNFVANKVVKLMIQNGHRIKDAKVLILGITFKENCPDIRNTRVVDIYDELNEFGVNVDIFDPLASHEEVKEEYGIDMISEIKDKYNAIILAVSHTEILELNISNHLLEDGIVYDTKSVLDKKLVHGRL